MGKENKINHFRRLQFFIRYLESVRLRSQLKSALTKEKAQIMLPKRAYIIAITLNFAHFAFKSCILFSCLLFYKQMKISSATAITKTKEAETATAMSKESGVCVRT